MNMTRTSNANSLSAVEIPTPVTFGDYCTFVNIGKLTLSNVYLGCYVRRGSRTIIISDHEGSQVVQVRSGFVRSDQVGSDQASTLGIWTLVALWRPCLIPLFR